MLSVYLQIANRGRQVSCSYMRKAQTVQRAHLLRSALAFKPLSELLCFGTCRLWDLAAHRALRKMLGHTAAVRGVSLTRDGTAAVSCSSDCTIKLWKARPALTPAASPARQPASQHMTC